MQKLISIVVPIYIVNTDLLKKSLDSLRCQSYKNLEIILVNDGTQKENIEYIKDVMAQDSRIHLIGEANYGVSHARNIGIEYATGEFISFVDADDYIDQFFCEKMLSAMHSERVDMVICGYNRVYDSVLEEINCNTNLGLFKGNDFLKKVLNVQEGVGYSHMKLIKRELLVKNHIRFDEELQLAEDAMFCMKLSQHISNVFKIDEPLYNYLFNADSVVRKYDIKYCEKILLSMRRAMGYIIAEYQHDEEVRTLMYNYVAYHLLLVIVNFCFHPEGEKHIVGKYKDLKELVQIKEFKEAVKRSNYEKLSLSRKVTLFSLKHKLYVVTAAIALVRQQQFEMRSRKVK